MPITKLYLIRHGQSGGNVAGTFGGHSPTPLSDLGIQQAEITGEAIAKERIDFVYSSDLKRAVQTAEPLADKLGIEVNKTSAFRERDVGVLEGLTFKESKEKYPKDYYALINRDINHKITEGESYRHLLRRGTDALKEILNSHNGKRVAIFSHTGAICYLTLYLIGAINRHTQQTPWLVTSNCGINRFEIRSRNNVRVLAINDTRHLLKMTGNNSFVSPRVFL